VNLQLFVNHGLNFLHRLKYEEPRLDIEYMTETMCNIEECLADEHVALCYCHLVFSLGRRRLDINGRKRPPASLLLTMG